MTIRLQRLLIGLSILGAGLAFAAGAARAADYATLALHISVDRPADEVWKKVGGFCELSAWLKISCVCTTGSGDLGSIRRIADRIDEVMVAKTSHSYTYTQPTSTILYHGTVDVEPDGPTHSTIIYSLLWDQSALATPEAKASDKAQRTKMFTGALESMKKLVEGK
jgi:hypothetical protein